MCIGMLPMEDIGGVGLSTDLYRSSFTPDFILCTIGGHERRRGSVYAFGRTVVHFDKGGVTHVIHG